MRHRYLFGGVGLTAAAVFARLRDSRDSQDKSDKSVFKRFADRAARRAARPAAAPYHIPRLPPFHYGPTHDLEGVWWISVYFLFACTLVEDLSNASHESAVSEDQLEAQRLAARRLLCSFTERLHAMEINGFYLEEVQYLHPRLREWGRELDEVREHLVVHYYHVEEDVENRAWDVTIDLYYACAEVWGGMSFEMREEGVHVQRLHLHD